MEIIFIVGSLINKFCNGVVCIEKEKDAYHDQKNLDCLDSDDGFAGNGPYDFML